MDERELWPKLLVELSHFLTIEEIAEAIGVSTRQVSNIKRGQRPIGLTAIKLVELHAKYRSPLHCQVTALFVIS